MLPCSVQGAYIEVRKSITIGILLTIECPVLASSWNMAKCPVGLHRQTGFIGAVTSQGGLRFVQISRYIIWLWLLRDDTKGLIKHHSWPVHIRSSNLCYFRLKNGWDTSRLHSLFADWQCSRSTEKKKLGWEQSFKQKVSSAESEVKYYENNLQVDSW